MIIHDVTQRSDEWRLLRAGMPTGSDFKQLITSTGTPSKSMADYAKVLAANKYAGRALDCFGGNQYTDRGTKLEPDACATYEFISGNTVDEVGFITDDLLRYGVSPDGLIGNDGVVEFKCQIAKEHVKTLLYYQKHGKAPTTYIAQTQGEMMVSERLWNDLVFYHPNLPMLIIRQQPEPKLYAALKAQINAVIIERDKIVKTLEGM